LPKLIIRVITFKLLQPIKCSRYHNVTDGRTDRRTDGWTSYDSKYRASTYIARRKSVNIWWRYEQEFGVLFFDSQCSDNKRQMRSATVALERALLSYYRLYIVIIALYVTVWPQFVMQILTEGFPLPG